MKKIIVVVFISLFLTPISLHALPKTIFIIESYHAEYPWDISYKQGITKILGNDYNLEFFQMDTKRLPAEQHPEQAEKAFKRYKELNPVLVMLGDDNALKYVGPRIAGADTPVVFLGINNNPRMYLKSLDRNITGVLERPLMKRSVALIDEIFTNNLKKILILFDSGITSKASVAETFHNRTTLNVSGVQIDLMLVDKIETWKKSVLNAKKNEYDAIIIGLYQTITDKDGKHVPAKQIINWTSNNTPVPPFGFWDFTVGKGKTSGGLVLFGQEQGETAARLAQEILAGKSPDQILPVTGKNGRFLFSRSQLNKWNITLPEHIGSRAHFVE